MRLLRLELKGFKSFANATTLHFGDADVVGVVGPNGSGKSNIVDAVRWVLGERKGVELRVDKMSSVIFNGTQDRRPAGVAQAFLTFDNDRGRLRTEFAEVTVGRLLYRDGTSEYRLNGVACRRKDITELFRDTGVAGDSYAIIALGMVDEILADRNNSRLRMLEQAAGINAYKASKREATTRLAHTRDDLARVEDLLREIEGNLRDLERQARRARRYRETKTRYREASLDYAYVVGRELRERSASVAAELARVEAQRAERTAGVAELEARIAGDRGEAHRRELHLSEARKRLGAVVGKLRRATSELQLARQKQDYLSAGGARWSAREGELLAERDRLDGETADLDTRRAAARERAAAAERAVAESASALEDARQLDERRRRGARERADALRAAERAYAEAERRHAAREARREIAAAESERLREAVARDADHLATLRAGVEAARGKLTGAEEVLAEADAAVAQNATATMEVDRRLERAREGLREAERERQRIRHELEMLAAVLDGMEGSGDGERYLGRDLGWKGKHPQLADVLTVDAAHRPAVERVLGPYLTSFIVRDFATAASGLAALREADLPTTTILVAARGLAAGPSMSAAPPGSRPLADLVGVRRPYAGVVAELLAEVFVCGEPVEGALLLPGQTVVAVDGRAVRTGVTLSGASAESRLGAHTGRRERLEQLRRDDARLAALESELAARVHEELAAREALANEAALDRQRTTASVRNGAERALAKSSARLAVSEAAAREREQRLQTSRAAEAELAAAAQESEGERARLWRELESARRAPDTASGGGDHEELAAATAAYNEARLEHVRRHNLAETLERELAYARERSSAVESELEGGRRRRAAEEAELAGLAGAIADLGTRLAEGEQTRARQAGELAAAERDYLARRDAAVEAEDRLRELRRRADESGALAAELRERRGEAATRLEGLAERLRVEFDLELDDALRERRAIDRSADELGAELRKRRKRLEGFGEVNALAVEAFDAMRERHDGIARQRDDILAAAGAIEGAIATLDREATRELTATFEAVRAHFVEVFRHLFDAADTADLVMVDPSRPLDSRIEIVARPKGKRPQTIAQLSGGEKTLTATAFLFALYLIKPAPFCIFDEVDAPLDDANVEKFNRIIKRFSADSQFVVVTHNKLTMAAVDTIYGVYMPERGVSAVTPVDFRELAHADVAELVG